MRWLLALIIALELALLPLPSWNGSRAGLLNFRAAGAVSSNIVISQVYGGGGASTGSPTYKYDYVELFNTSASPAALAGFSLQYGSSSGNFGAVSYNFPAGTVITAGKYLLIKTGTGGSVGAELPLTADQTAAINMSASGGKLALVNSTTALGCGATATPCALPDARIIDSVAYGSANNAEGGVSAGNGVALDSTKGAVRKFFGCLDTDHNNNDFDIVINPVPRNNLSPGQTCEGVNFSPIIAAPANPAITILQDSPPFTVSLSGSDDDGSYNWSAIPGSGVSSVIVAAGQGTPGVSYKVTLQAGYSGTASFTAMLSDNINPPASQIVNILVNEVTITPIYNIQSAARSSPQANDDVFYTTQGVVSGVKSNGFFMQDTIGDGNPATSDGIFVFTGSPVPAGAAAGNLVRASCKVTEFSGLTELTGCGVNLSVLSAGHTITPQIVSTDPARNGPEIRKPPPVIADPSSLNTYNPNLNGLDFWEALEGMLVQVDNPLVVGPTDQFGQFFVVPDNGTGASGLNPRGSLEISQADFNPERVGIDKGIINTPDVAVGDRITGSISGPLDFTFNNYRIQSRLDLTVDATGRVQPENLVPLNNPNYLRVASYNVENFVQSPAAATTSADQQRITVIANHIRLNLAAPDLMVLNEIQDDSGSLNDGMVTASANLTRLSQRIYELSSATISYSFRQIDPLNNQDGGQPGGNIRQVFFYRTDRGLSFVDKPGGGPITANSVLAGGGLLYSPGRIYPDDASFQNSRKPLTGEFMFQGQRLIVIANHLNSKGGDQPLYNNVQPPELSTEATRNNQAALIRNFVTQLQQADPLAKVIVTGDLNDFQFANPLTILKDGTSASTTSVPMMPVSAGQTLADALENSASTNGHYSYIYDGNAQRLDHLLYSQGLAGRLVGARAVHLNADYHDVYAGKGSDHDPVTAVFTFGCPFTLVTSASDNGAGGCGTLSNALAEAALAPEPVTITFAANLTAVTLNGALPSISSGTKILGGYTVVNGRSVPKVRLTAGAGASGNALTLNNNSMVSGLAITGFNGYAIVLAGSSNTVAYCWLGTADGLTAAGNGGGAQINAGAGNNRLGLTGLPESGNLIAGNSGYGVLVNGGPDNRLYYNWFGLQKDGVTPLVNGQAVKVNSGGQLNFGPGNRVRS